MYRGLAFGMHAETAVRDVPWGGGGCSSCAVTSGWTMHTTLTTSGLAYVYRYVLCMIASRASVSRYEKRLSLLEQVCYAPYLLRTTPRRDCERKSTI